jgi:hypothetical protein
LLFIFILTFKVFSLVKIHFYWFAKSCRITSFSTSTHPKMHWEIQLMRQEYSRQLNRPLYDLLLVNFLFSMHSNRLYPWRSLFRTHCLQSFKTIKKSNISCSRVFHAKTNWIFTSWECIARYYFKNIFSVPITKKPVRL